MKLERILKFKQASLFPTEDDLVNDLTRKFPGISRWQIQQTLREMRSILQNKTDSKYSHRELMRWTEIALRDLQHAVEERAKVAKLLEKPSSRKSRKTIIDWRMLGAGEDKEASTFETKR